MDPSLILSPPLVSADLSAIGGRIKGRIEDFEVEEIPAYEPCGTGAGVITAVCFGVLLAGAGLYYLLGFGD